MTGFLRILCLIGLPLFAIASCFIWKPAPATRGAARSVAGRLAWSVVFFVASLVVVGLWIFYPLALWLIWKPAARPRSTRDRLAWSLFVLRICLMVTVVIYSLSQEREGDWRSRNTIRLHARIFLALSIFSLAGPLVVYLVEVMTKRSPSPAGKKQPIDDGDETVQGRRTTNY